MKIFRLITLLTLYLPTAYFAQEHAGGYTFIENKGQWPDQVNYKADLRSGYVYLEEDGLLFDLYDAAAVNKYVQGHYQKELRKDLDILNWHSYKVKFVDANVNPLLKPENKSPEYYNYFLGNNPKKWGSGAKGYFNVNYQEIYEGIDFTMYTQLFNLKYDFIVHPGADPTMIKLHYDGVDKIDVIKKKLHVYTSVNHIIEDEPIAYQVINGERSFVACEYQLGDDNTLQFKVKGNYDKSKDLIIDPTLVFSTYSGSFSNNFGYSATFDSKGFLYSGSSAFGNSYPTTTGAYNENWNLGIVDIAISKFDTSGTSLIYSTYIGGNSDELPHSLIVNSSDELFVFGTTSSPNYPTTPSAFDTTFNLGVPNDLSSGLGVNYDNGSDLIVTRLSADGETLIASTFIGGSDNDGLNSIPITPNANPLRYNYADEIRGEIEIDQNDNIYIATCTQSNDFPITTGVFQPLYGGGNIDGCVIKMDNGLQNIIWSSYLGGELHDAIYSLAIGGKGNVYVTGGTESLLFPITVDGLHTTYQGGRSDGFVTLIDKDGSQILNSTYFGSPTYDQSYFVELDKEGNVYLFGQTEVTDSTFIENVSWAVPSSGQYISKLGAELDTLLYSTVFGAGNGINISPTAFLVDLCSKMYLSGWGGSTNSFGTNNNAGNTFGMPITSDAYQSITDGSDFYLMVLEDDASGIVYGSYFGGPTSAEHVDGGTSRFDRKGKVYQAMCAGCGGNSDMPIFPSGTVVSSTNNNSCNLGVFKMDFNLPVVVADFEVPPIGCAPFTFNFNNTSLSQPNTFFFWDFGDGDTSNLENPSHTYSNPGTYTISLSLRDTATCNFADTITRDIIILGDTNYALNDILICPGDINQIGLLPNPDTSITYTWSPSDSLSNDSIANPFANPDSTTNYTVLISNGFCTDTVQQQVIVNTPLLEVSNDTILCDDLQNVTLWANAMGTSGTYTWSSSSTFLDTLNNPITDSTITVSPSTTRTYYVQVSNNGCYNYDSVIVTIAINQLTIVAPPSLCLGDTTLLSVSNSVQGSNLIYDWSPDAELLSPDGNDSVWVSPSTTKYFHVMATNSVGCIIMDSALITVDPLPVTNFTLTATPDSIIEGDASQLNLLPSIGGYTYSWQPNSSLSDPSITNPMATPETTTTYTVTISGTINGCEKTESVIVYVTEIICDEPEIFIPNGFTPDGNNTNDDLYVRGTGIDKMLLRIYDRWGELMFETTDQSIGWDGTYKGKDCDPAVFVYYLEITCVDEETYFKKGNITLIR